LPAFEKCESAGFLLSSEVQFFLCE
jgi:hypothetical protein